MLARLRRPVVALLTLSLAVGCGSVRDSAGSPASSAGATITSASGLPRASATAVPGGAPVTVEYLPGLEADVYLPEHVMNGKPVVLLVPGGGWETADRTGLAPLAEQLRAYGNVVVNATYSTIRQGTTFPRPVQDVLCAAAFARRQAADLGAVGGPLVVVGHSAGGHLAAVAALSGTGLAAPCADPPTTIDGLVGLAGVYDTTGFAEMMTPFFGVAPSGDPARWESGDPLTYARTGTFPPRLAVLLLHGDADTVVPLAQSTALAVALKGNGAPATQLTVLPGVDHERIFAADVAGGRIGLWLRATFSAWAGPSPSTAASAG